MSSAMITHYWLQDDQKTMWNGLNVLFEGNSTLVIYCVILGKWLFFCGYWDPYMENKLNCVTCKAPSNLIFGDSMILDITLKFYNYTDLYRK